MLKNDNLITVNFLCIISKAISVCDTGWTNEGSLCYKSFANSEVTFLSALEICRQNEADLLMARSAQENVVAEQILDAFNVNEAWLGLREISYDTTFQAYTWEWLDGSSVGYTKWRGSTNFNRACASIRHDGEWRTKDCDPITKKVICQKLATVSYCPENWNRTYSWDICYQVLGKGKIGEAETQCSSLKTGSAEIVMPITERQNSFLNYLSEELIDNNAIIHIGLKDQNLVFGSEWKWADGVKLSDTGFSAWSSGSTPISVFPSYVTVANKIWTNHENYHKSAFIVCQCHLLTHINQIQVQGRAYCPVAPNPRSLSTSEVTSLKTKSLSTLHTTSELAQQTSEETSVASTQMIQTTTPQFTLVTSIADTCTRVCSCNGSSFEGLTTNELSIRLKDMKANLTVEKSTLSKTIRKLTCADDPRVSSQYIGCFGAVMISVILRILVFIDCLSFLT